MQILKNTFATLSYVVKFKSPDLFQTNEELSVSTRATIVLGARLDRFRNIYGLNTLNGVFLLCVSAATGAVVYLLLKPCMEMFVELSCLRHADNRSIADACISDGSPLSNSVGTLGDIIITGAIITALCVIGRSACAWFTNNTYRLLDIYNTAKRRWNIAICIAYLATTGLSLITMGAAMIL